jgi:hypothetical protein
MAAESTKKHRQELLKDEIKKQEEIIKNLKLEEQTEDVQQQVLIYLHIICDYISNFTLAV